MTDETTTWQRLLERLRWTMPVAVTAVAATVVLGGHAAAPPAPAIITRLIADPSGNPAEALRSITVSGTGEVKGSPDTATISIGVETQAAHATDCLQQNATKTTALVALLQADGVSGKDIQTGQLSVQPTYSDGRVITGYTAEETLTVTFHDLSRAGAILDAAAGVAGDAARVQGIQFGISDTGSLLADARKQAVQSAMTKAQQMADAAGVHILDVRSITESSAVSPVYHGAADLPAAGAAISTPVDAGQETLSVSVTLVDDLG